MTFPAVRALFVCSVLKLFRLVNFIPIFGMSGPSCGRVYMDIRGLGLEGDRSSSRGRVFVPCLGHCVSKNKEFRDSFVM